MAHTVDDLRNEIRERVGRFERVTSAPFTKEDLAAICDAVGYGIETAGRLPPKAEMRAGILWRIGRLDEPDAGDADRPFRKAELEAIVDVLGEGE